MGTPVFAARELGFRYPHATHAALKGLTLHIASGEFYAVIGPNGSGKSTLARLLLGLIEPTSGAAEFLGRRALDWDRRELARSVGVVPQNEELVFPMSVHALVSMGRYPHLGSWRAESAHDRAAVDRALDACDMTMLRDRLVTQLSGGERQRARIARALAQEPHTLVLDEPTAALDIAHEMAIFELLARLRAEHGVTVLVITHNVNLAARYAERMLLLDDGSTAAEAAPADVLTRARIEQTYQWPVTVQPHPGPGPDAGAPQVSTLRPAERPR